MSGLVRTDPGFATVGPAAVRNIIESATFDAVSVAREIYALHDAGETACPSVPFLRFPAHPDARAIALPAYVGGGFQVAGVKWIASFPGNVRINLSRAAASIVLNDISTGRPIAYLEGAQISALRTAASAALAAVTMNRGSRSATSLGMVGCGVIARSIARMLSADGWRFEQVRCFDTRAEAAADLCGWIDFTLPTLAREAAQVSDAIRHVTSADIVCFATTALEPHVSLDEIGNSNALILHISLRDLKPEIILSAFNIVDDLTNCFSEKTSLQLTEFQAGQRSFVAGTLTDLDARRIALPAEGLRIFSPFGLGALDIGFAKLVLDEAIAKGVANLLQGFV